MSFDILSRITRSAGASKERWREQGALARARSAGAGKERQRGQGAPARARSAGAGKERWRGQVEEPDGACGVGNAVSAMTMDMVTATAEFSARATRLRRVLIREESGARCLQGYSPVLLAIAVFFFGVASPV
jgi:hypothetical protein